jgi:hypothetical protein
MLRRGLLERGLEDTIADWGEGGQGGEGRFSCWMVRRIDKEKGLMQGDGGRGEGN